MGQNSVTSHFDWYQYKLLKLITALIIANAAGKEIYCGPGDNNIVPT